MCIWSGFSVMHTCRGRPVPCISSILNFSKTLLVICHYCVLIVRGGNCQIVHNVALSEGFRLPSIMVYIHMNSQTNEERADREVKWVLWDTAYQSVWAACPSLGQIDGLSEAERCQGSVARGHRTELRGAWREEAAFPLMKNLHWLLQKEPLKALLPLCHCICVCVCVCVNMPLFNNLKCFSWMHLCLFSCACAYVRPSCLLQRH